MSMLVELRADSPVALLRLNKPPVNALDLPPVVVPSFKLEWGAGQIGFTVPDDSTFAGGMGGTVPSRLQSEAYYLPLGYPIGELAYMGNYILNLGVRIEGVNPVPLPPSLLLLGGGLLGLGFLGRRRS